MRRSAGLKAVHYARLSDCRPLSGRAAYAQLQGQVYASGFQSPVAFVQDPTDRAVQFVVEQSGRIRVVRNGTALGNDFLNLTGNVSCCGERGLLGLAFAPDYASSGRFYVNFTNVSGDTVVARFMRSSTPTLADRFVEIRPAAGGDAAIRQPALFESQRRPPGVRARWLSLHRARRRRLGQRSRPSRAEPERAARQDAAHRRQRAR